MDSDILSLPFKALEVAHTPNSNENSKMVPPAGLEPALPKKTDFESVASTNSATGARKMRTR